MISEVKEYKSTKKLAIPIFFEGLLGVLIGNIDVVMLSAYSIGAVATIGVANQVISNFNLLFTIVSVGTSINIVNSLGAKKKHLTVQIIDMSLFINLLIGFAFSIISIFFSEKLLMFLDIPIELMKEGRTYVIIVGGISFIQSLIITLSAIIRAYGYVRELLYANLLMNISNIFGNSIAIFGLFNIKVTGVFGVALSTAVARVIGLIIMVLLLSYKCKWSLKLSRIREFKLSILKNVLTIGIPSAGESIVWQISQTYLLTFVSSMGVIALTARSYMNIISSFISLFCNAIGQSTALQVGYLYGADECNKADIMCKNNMKLAAKITLMVGISIAIGINVIGNKFISNSNILNFMKQVVYIQVILELGRSYNVVVASSLKCVYEIKRIFLFSIFSNIVIAPLCGFLLCKYYDVGLAGVIIACALDECLRGLYGAKCWKSGDWKNKRSEAYFF